MQTSGGDAANADGAISYTGQDVSPGVTENERVLGRRNSRCKGPGTRRPVWLERHSEGKVSGR